MPILKSYEKKLKIIRLLQNEYKRSEEWGINLLMDKVLKSCFPKKVLWRLTLTNIIVIATFIILSSWAIYNTACFLVEGMGQINAQKQNEFNTTLFQYLWIFSVSVIIMG